MQALALRLLHERSEHAYTSSTHEAMSEEPEAISAAEQRYLTRQARRAASVRELGRFEVASVQLRDALEELSRLRLDIDIASEVRALRRDAERLARRVARAR